MSSSAPSHLSPAFPGRAPWGTAAKLRAWQAAALEQYLAAGQPPRDFLAVATPGAGKTTFALRAATDLMKSGRVKRITVVTPTEHLKRQWADAADRVGVRIDPQFRNAQGAHGRDFDGVAVTYAQVSSRPLLHRARTETAPTLVILDEVHHGGDALSWGDAVREAFEPARHRLALTGTPFRSDTAAIPFVEYVEDGAGVRRSRADYSYGYGEALRDGVVRPVLFLAYSGRMRWRTRAGEEVAARLGEPLTKDVTAQAWRTALDPSGEWIRAVLQAADIRLSEVRRGVPDAGGLVIATDQAQARAYARVLRSVAGEPVVLVLSDDAGASSRIEDFASGRQRWMVAVRMVSEGVDVPRLAVGVYATSTATPLFFAQAVGRFVRARRRGETASLFLPSVAPLLQHAGELERERDHALDRRRGNASEGDLWSAEDVLLAAARADTGRGGASGPDDGQDFEALEADAEFDRVLFDGGEFGTAAMPGSAEEQDYLGLPGLLDADQMTALLHRRQADQQRQQNRLRTTRSATAGPEADGPKADGPKADGLKAAGPKADGLKAAGPEADDPASGHRDVAAARKQLHQLVGAWSRRTGQPHATVHADLRRACGGPPVPQASIAQVRERIETLRRWFVGRR
ncbi:MAG: DEAD/DEAH box helicase [Angustibacter sp.]